VFDYEATVSPVPAPAVVQENPLASYIQTPKEQLQKDRMEAIIAALRGGAVGGRSPVGVGATDVQAGRVTPTNIGGSALSGLASGLSMGKGLSGIFNSGV